MLILGHRGCRRLHRDNSLEAIRFALNHYADGVEIDLRWDKDSNEIKLAHDPITEGDQSIGFLEALPLLKAFHGELQLEVKTQTKTAYQRINDIILPLCAAHPNWRITSFNKRYLAMLPATQKSGLLIDRLYPDPIMLAKRLNCSAIAVRCDLLHSQLLNRIQEQTFELTVWTENSLKKTKHWRKKKVDLLITDQPHLILSGH